MSTATGGPDAESALAAFAAKDFASWSGLADPTPLADVVRFFGADPDRFGRWFLGADSGEAFYLVVEVAGYPVPVRVWYRGDVVVKLSADRPGVDLASLAELGEPAARLDYRLDVLTVERGEHVYPERGVAVSVAPDGSSISEISVFAPTDLAGYVNHLRSDDDLIEHPGPDLSSFFDEPDLEP